MHKEVINSKFEKFLCSWFVVLKYDRLFSLRGYLYIYVHHMLH